MIKNFENYPLGISWAVFEILIREPKVSQLADTMLIKKDVTSCKIAMNYLKSKKNDMTL